MAQQEGKREQKKCCTKTKWPIERVKNQLIPTKKYEDTEDCKRWRNPTQTENEQPMEGVVRSVEWKKVREEVTKVEEMNRNALSRRSTKRM